MEISERSEEADNSKIPDEETNDLEKEEGINPVHVYDADEASNSADTSLKYSLELLSDVSSTILETKSSPRRSGSSSKNNNSPPNDGNSLCSDITAESKPHNSSSGKWEALKEIMSRDKELAPRHFLVVRAIGEANLGDVFLTRLADTSTYFATKVMNRNHLESLNKLQCLLNELEILRMLDHPFLPTLYHYFEEENLSALVMEYCPGGDLFSLRQKKPGNRFSERDTRFYASEVLSALEYLHLMRIVYRDLKPENILIKEDGHIMLTDFYSSFIADAGSTELNALKEDKAAQKLKSTRSGLSGIEMSSKLETMVSYLRRSKFSKKKKLRNVKSAQYLNTSIPELIHSEPSGDHSMSIVGTYEYLAPEMIEGKRYGSSVDWWAFGIFIYELLFGKTPFRGPGDFEKPIKFPESIQVSSAAKDLIKRLLVKDPKLRLAYNGGASDIKQHPFFHGTNWALLCYSNPPPVIPGPLYCHHDGLVDQQTLPNFVK